MQSEKRKELIRSLKFLLFSISAGAIQILSFTLVIVALAFMPNGLFGHAEVKKV